MGGAFVFHVDFHSQTYHDNDKTTTHYLRSVRRHPASSMGYVRYYLAAPRPRTVIAVVSLRGRDDARGEGYVWGKQLVRFRVECGATADDCLSLLSIVQNITIAITSFLVGPPR
jgi:hypothetical protein